MFSKQVRLRTTARTGTRSRQSRGSARRILGDGLRGEEVLVIGDTALDIRCGRAIQAKVLAVATGGATLDELQTHQPDWAVPTLANVTARQVCSSE